MSTTTPLFHRAAHAPLGHSSFAGVVRSEWIKLYTLRSTFWVLLSILVLIAGSAGLGALFTNVTMVNQLAPGDVRLDTVIGAVIGGNEFAQLLAAILGVLVIGGEFSVGMIRSSFAAVPRRTAVLSAKAIVVFAAVFVIALISFAGSWLVALPIMVGRGVEVDIPFATILWSSAGLSASLGLIAVFGLGITTVVRSTVGGISIVLGLLLVVPIVLSLLTQLTRLAFIESVADSLIGRAATDIGHVRETVLEPWQNLLVVVAWSVAAFVAAAIVLRRRDA
jgi:ABC-2 type transport system permease protein